MIALKPGDVFLESGLSLATAAITELYRQRGFATGDGQVRRRRNRSAQAGRRLDPAVDRRRRKGRARWSERCGSPATRRSPKRSSGR